MSDVICYISLMRSPENVHMWWIVLASETSFFKQPLCKTMQLGTNPFA